MKIFDLGPVGYFIGVVCSVMLDFSRSKNAYLAISIFSPRKELSVTVVTIPNRRGDAWSQLAWNEKGRILPKGPNGNEKKFTTSFNN